MNKSDRRFKKDDDSFKKVVYLSGGILLIAVVTFILTFIIYGNKINDSNSSKLDTSKAKELVPNTIYIEEMEDTSAASSQVGKTVEEMQQEEVRKAEQVIADEAAVALEKTKAEENIAKEKAAATKLEEAKKAAEVIKAADVVVPQKDPTFIKPVDGTIIKTYAQDTLLYSNTLKEWMTHLGIDIKADKTTIVKSSATGTIKAIKNDPRYGLTIIMEHVNGFTSVYSNLATSEFVKVGEKIEQGQAIGTVGDTATFELLDDSHLHFEILKNNDNLDPNLYVVY